MTALAWNKHPLVKTIYSMQRFRNAGTHTDNTPLNIHPHPPRKGVTTHYSDEIRQHLTGSPVPTFECRRL
jgi:hypothetical protein